MGGADGAADGKRARTIKDECNDGMSSRHRLRLKGYEDDACTMTIWRHYKLGSLSLRAGDAQVFMFVLYTN